MGTLKTLSSCLCGNLYVLLGIFHSFIMKRMIPGSSAGSRLGCLDMGSYKNIHSDSAAQKKLGGGSVISKLSNSRSAECLIISICH